jgi:hypothetical protein
MVLAQTILTALHGVILVFFAAMVISAGRRVHQRRNTYRFWVLPFAYLSFGSWIFWVLQYSILIADPLTSAQGGILQNISVWLGIMQNALWAIAILSLHVNHFPRVLLTLPLLAMFAIVIALLIAYQPTTFTDVPFLMIGGVSAATIFTVFAISITKLPVSKVFAGTFFVYGYFQWFWHYLGFASLSQNRSVLFAFAFWHLALFYAWDSLIAEMLIKFRVMISSTVNDLQQERDAVDRALRTLNLEGFRSEILGSLPDTPEAICKSRAEQCHIFILMTGERYGHIIRSRDISVVEFEHNVARAQDPGKILVYIKKGVDREPRLQKFVERLEDFEDGYVTTSFTTPNELSERIPLDVMEWLNSQRARVTTRNGA